MGKKAIAAVVVALVLIGGVAFVSVNSKDKDNATNTTNQQSQTDSESAEQNNNDSATNNKLPVQTVGQQPDCSLYTLEQISEIWGVPMTDTDVDGSKVIQISGPQNYQYECDYNETNSGKGLSVVINYKVYESEEAAQTSVKNTRDGAKFGDKVYFVNDEVAEIGDEAFFSKSANEASLSNKTEEQLYARTGNVVYLITAVNLDGTQPNYREKILETYRLHL